MIEARKDECRETGRQQLSYKKRESTVSVFENWKHRRRLITKLERERLHREVI